MCRLLAFASSDDTTLQSLLTPQEFENYRQLSTLHGDGWGAAWQAAGASVRQANSVERAVDDEEFLFITREPASASIVHLRWATSGFPVCVENTHPFTDGTWRFAHNGAIAHSERLLEFLSAERRAALQGSTDSEIYFQLFLEKAEALGDIVTGLRATVALIREVCGLGSLNCLLLTEGRMIAVQAFGATPAPTASLAESVGGADHLPEGHGEDYYRLRYAVRRGSVLVASTGVGGEDWRDLGDDAIIDADLDAGRVVIRRLVDGAELQSIALVNNSNVA